MRPEQTVAEMAGEVLARQARAHAQRTGQSLAEAIETVRETPAGRQLEKLGSGAHQHEEARYWQENLLWERAFERSEDMVTSDTLPRLAQERHYSWVENYVEWSEGKETRTEYRALLEAELASPRE